MDPIESALVDEAYAAVAAGDVPTSGHALLVVSGSAGRLQSAFPVEQVGLASIGAALLAAADLLQARGGSCPAVAVDRGHVAAAVRSERFFAGPGAQGGGFAPLSRFWRASDGWIRTHANYPWHRQALLATLGTSDEPDALGAAIARLERTEIEERVYSAGGIAVAVRTPAEWLAHPQSRALSSAALVEQETVAGAPPRTRAAVLPATGVRVLDFTRVIAGPVCTRLLGALGADVLRVDPPHRPDGEPGALSDTLLGKRSTILDLDPTAPGRIGELLDRADVVVCGYRPGSLDRFGLDPRSLAENHPGLVVVGLNAWGHSGPWSSRRGFDSVVQAATGIASEASSDGTQPGALPCQLLDHATGYLAAAAALAGLRAQTLAGGTRVYRLSLARTARWLTGAPRNPAARHDPGAAPLPTDDVDDWRQTLEFRGGEVSAVSPPGRLGEFPLRWPPPTGGYGDAAPEWVA